MDRGAWWAAVHGVTKLGATERLTHAQCTYMESRKMVLKNLFRGQQWRNRCRGQTYGHGERGEGEMYRKSNMETYNAICKTDSQQEFAVWLRKLKRGSVSN